MEANRLFDLLNIQVEKNPQSFFLTAKENNIWTDYTFEQVQEFSNRVCQLLIDLEIKKNDTIALISTNRVEWNFVDFGAQQLGITVIPIYPTISEKDYEYIFNDASIKFAFVGDESIYKKVQPLLEKTVSLNKIYTFDKIKNANSFYESLPKKYDSKKISEIKNTISTDDIATIIYTSGTTGNPKGVMLTHKNIISNVNGVKEITPLLKGQKALSFLPLCHSFERMVFYAYLSFGIHIYYAESIEKLKENLLEVKPYCFTTVPRMLEKVYDAIIAKAETLEGTKKTIFHWAMQVGGEYEIGAKKSIFYNLKLEIARKLVFEKWKAALGGNIKFIITGAAAIQPKLITLFTAAGIDVLEGYGLTETSPVLCCNRIDEKERCIGTVGMPIPNVEIKFADDGEILAKGPNIMKGYFNQPELTNEVIDKDGWFHTGDIGTWIKKNGNQFLKITDRKKELFKTAGGKYIAPQVIENKMKESPYIEQMVVVGGDDKKFIAAIIVPCFIQLSNWATKNEIKFSTNDELIIHPKIKKLFHDEINKYNVDFGHWEQVKEFILSSTEWTTENGTLTPTMKPIRKKIYELYKTEIEAVFNAVKS